MPIQVDWSQFGFHSLQLAIAFALTLPVGLNREHSRKLGLRTIPLVAVAACGFILVARFAYPDTPDAQARILAGVVTGIGFLGGGAIVKSGVDVHGTATAAAIWCTAAIGAGVGYELWGVAAMLAVFNFVILVFVRPLGGVLDDDVDERGPEEQIDHKPSDSELESESS